MKTAEALWTTWWSKAQRGMGVQPLHFTSSQEVHIKLPTCSMIRFRFSAFYDTSSFTIKNASFKYLQNHTKYEVMFHGCNDVIIHPQDSIISDPIVCKFQVNEEIMLTYEICGKENCMSGVSLSSLDEVSSLKNEVYGFHGVDVVSDELKGCICVFGDSIVEQGMYTSVLRTTCLPYGYVVVNAGISGNRLLRGLEDVLYPQVNGQTQRLRDIPLSKQCFGIAGVNRFYRDVISSHQNVCNVVIAIGINDLYQPGSFCANRKEFPSLYDMKQGYVALQSMLKKTQIRYTFCAITPFFDAVLKDTKKESLRMQVNTWLRQTYEDVSFVCFDDELMDEHHALQAHFHDGDGLHPSAKGGGVMAKVLEKEIWRMLR